MGICRDSIDPLGVYAFIHGGIRSARSVFGHYKLSRAEETRDLADNTKFLARSVLSNSVTQHFWTAKYDINVGSISLAESLLRQSLF